MLTPKQLQNMPKPLTDIYSELSDFVLQDIAMRIAGAAKITDTAEYQMYRARALGMSTDAIKKEIARINGVAEAKIEELIREAAERSDEFDRKMLGVSGGVPLADNTQLQKLMAAQIEQTRGLCTNLTGTLGFAQRTADGRMVYGSATDFLRKQMDMAQMKVMTGVCDYNTAVRQACFALADSGLRTVYYASGHSDRIEVAVRRALMTSVSQLTQKISEQNAAEFGADGWEISAHVGARPSHAVYQGRQYSNSQYETIVLPLITDYNCRHSAYPIILGVTKPAYTDEQLAALDPPPFTYEGRRYTAYEAQQQMRKMERAMRRHKDRCVVADAIGDKDAFTAASIKLRRQKDYYEDFCKAAGTYTEYERTFVSGYNRHLASKTGAVTRKQNAFKNAQITLTNPANGGIIKKEISIFDEYRKNLPDIKHTLHSIETERRTLNYEVGTIIDRKGNVLNVTDGKAHNVSLPAELLKDAVFTHNHPSGGCFSDQDLYSAIASGLLELRASTPQGTFYSLLRTEKSQMDNAIADEYKKVVSISNAMKAVQEDLKKGIINKDEINAKGFNIYFEYMSKLGDAYLSENAEKFGFIYSKGVI
ncbi:MAG: phage minor capsid protein [Oscillospiraceae bacterium]|nr:phage minor capsid protein [Oscillospiraceae bacterium]